ncbi:Tol-Pal system beta propeller repeat protein TolB [Lutimaribacter sp. EGI FJ00015]|uniref:Tol-Pal system beta propeller repeat protein TolB n=1 Tax=Lutimaribacter degradans TaxID=2945989 RepID=A0ACC5ZQZ3_9RHOB|nr:Tol-Pal system beta propeller repeat protein TolB [Lutimaribacter sp. EGI FJ00013]MCM2560593.1 Tol-Pal system beta propeller repeat protein TolB [Lutimaribacter sp. EGI FJ00013]MCO0612464.1 Tol-Pal system beta propeller repeat protein TolB [Lutimaribacter sp. EGI FJ00015]MCO0634417.1 Tol-Pal system beta propeller repeat protein TolB [Lutimaribacter sp. EGI FJ00014]
MMLRFLTLIAAFWILALPAQAQDGPLRITIDEGVIEPLPFAVPEFVAENAAAAQMAEQIARVVAADLTGTGLFREIPEDAFISKITSFSSPVEFADWRAINAQALISGAVSTGSDGRISVKFRLYDVFAGQEMGAGLQFDGTQDGWRRMAHKVSDAVYSRLTGESPYFDSRVVFVAESGTKGERRKRLAIMDYDGANVQYLTDSSNIVLAPRFSPTGDRILYTSYETGFPRIYVLDVASVGRRALENQPGSMSFSPRFSPDGQTVIYSLTQGGNTDIYRMNINGDGVQRLTNAPSIETAPSFSPDGSQIVFESDRSGNQQLYIMPSSGGEPRRISFGPGRYGTPVWSPRGDLIAFTKQSKGRFHIGVMRTDGSEERLLTASFLDEGPTWAPNGRVIMFTRETQGAGGQSSLYSVDITGRNLKRVRTETGASDPSWSPLQE